MVIDVVEDQEVNYLSAKHSSYGLYLTIPSPYPAERKMILRSSFQED